MRAYLAERFDHRDVGEVVAVPSSENIARHLFDWCSGGGLHLREGVRVEAVRVGETGSTWAEYAPGDRANP
ncbi:6-pyruvoyl trahydropterin synthase family protein [Micromonospora sp. NPDC051925]|uniref:6-pyruvoyl trahydropterin synthase family protein n=1 Tax=Micromonospora sp. NPDC051925 TaxID=3364288 RepID=UPI0037C5E667